MEKRNLYYSPLFFWHSLEISLGSHDPICGCTFNIMLDTLLWHKKAFFNISLQTKNFSILHGNILRRSDKHETIVRLFASDWNNLRKLFRSKAISLKIWELTLKSLSPLFLSMVPKKLLFFGWELLVILTITVLGF